MEVLHTSRFLDISYEPAKKCLIQTWKAFCNSEEYRSGQQLCLKFFVEKGCKNFISDTTNAGLLKKEDIDWVTEVITPQLTKAGMPCINLVLPASAFTKMTLSNLEKTEKESGSNTPLNFFGSLEAAMQSF